MTAVSLRVIRVTQPLGDLYIGKIKSQDLWRVTHYDMRQIETGEDGIFKITGIQRKLDGRRVEEIASYVEASDAVFPTAVVLAISSDSLEILDDSDPDSPTVNLIDDPNTVDLFGEGRVARVIDGQHRIEGLRVANKHDFDVNVAFLVDADLEDQARVFATVNLAQTKVNKSHVYDLFSFSTNRSPERTAHITCLRLDQTEGSPLHGRIKRLGTATPGRLREEPLSQATVVEGLLRHIVKDKIQLIGDRDRGRKGLPWPPVAPEEARKLVLRPFFVEGRDEEMAELIWNYFAAVHQRWTGAWEAGGRGAMLPRTNGFRALMRFFQDAYNYVAYPGELVSEARFAEIFARSSLSNDDFTTERFPPGTSGETRLYNELKAALES